MKLLPNFPNFPKSIGGIIPPGSPRLSSAGSFFGGVLLFTFRLGRALNHIARIAVVFHSFLISLHSKRSSRVESRLSQSLPNRSDRNFIGAWPLDQMHAIRGTLPPLRRISSLSLSKPVFAPEVFDRREVLFSVVFDRQGKSRYPDVESLTFQKRHTRFSLDPKVRE